MKILKIKNAGLIIYPATITSAIKDPNSLKTQSEINELLDRIDFEKNIPEPNRLIYINITLEDELPTIKDDIKLGKILINFDGIILNKYCTLEVQGASSALFIKKNWKIKFYSDEECSNSYSFRLNNMVPHSEYVIKSNFIDATQCRNIVNNRLWEKILQSRKDYPNREIEYDYIVGDRPNYERFPTGALGHVDGFPCILYINDEFYGLGNFNIGKKSCNYNLDKSNENHILMSAEEHNDLFNYVESQWEIKSPSVTTNVKTKVNNWFNSNKLEGGEFKNQFTLYHDLLNAIDYFLHLNFIGSTDTADKNFLLMSKNGIKFYIMPYDLDCTYGLKWTGMELLPYNLLTVPREDLSETNTHKFWNKFYNAFKDEINARYKELRKSGIFTVNTVYNIAFPFISKFGDTFKLEFNKWDIPSNITSTSTKYATGGCFTGLPQMLDWLKNHIEYLDTRFDYTIIEEDTEELLLTMPVITDNGFGLITLSSIDDAIIKYTIDGSTPTKSSTTYSNPIQLQNGWTIKAIAVKNNYKNSEVLSYLFTLVIEQMSGEAFANMEVGDSILALMFGLDSTREGYEGDSLWYKSPSYLAANYLVYNKSFDEVKVSTAVVGNTTLLEAASKEDFINVITKESDNTYSILKLSNSLYLGHNNVLTENKILFQFIEPYDDWNSADTSWSCGHYPTDEDNVFRIVTEDGTKALRIQTGVSQEKSVAGNYIIDLVTGKGSWTGWYIYKVLNQLNNTKIIVLNNWQQSSDVSVINEVSLNNTTGLDYVLVIFDEFNTDMSSNKSTDGWYLVINFGGFLGWGTTSNEVRCIVHYNPTLKSIRIQLPYAISSNKNGRIQINNVDSFTSLKIGSQIELNGEVIITNTENSFKLDNNSNESGVTEPTADQIITLKTYWNKILNLNPLKFGINNLYSEDFVNRTIRVKFKD